MHPSSRFERCPDWSARVAADDPRLASGGRRTYSRTPRPGRRSGRSPAPRGCHASTVLRQVRRVEAWRDDPLVDEALERHRPRPRRRLFRAAVTKEVPSMRIRPSSRPQHRTRGSSARRAASCGGCARRAPSWRWRRPWRRRWCCARWCRDGRTASPWSIATWRTPSRCRSGSPARRRARSPATASPPSAARR